MEPALSSEFQKILDEEAALYERVRQAVRTAALARRGVGSGTDAAALRDLRDAAATARARDLPNLLEQLHSSQALARRQSHDTLPDMRAPYFAHIRLQEQDRIRDILIGHETFLDSAADINIIDWRNAPIAKVFFLYREGDDYEVELPQRTAKGKIITRRILQFDMGKLIGINAPQANFRLRDENWAIDQGATNVALTGGEGKAMRGLGTGLSGQPSADIAALLDPTQFRILQSESDAALLILGGAGSGKTTIALHRLANLNRRDPEFFAQHKMLVIVPEHGLVRLSRKLLAGLKLDRVPLSTFDEWVATQAKSVLPQLNKRIYSAPPPRVMRFKRHVAVTTCFPELEAIKRDKMAKYIAKFLPQIPDAAKKFQDFSATNLLHRVDQLNQFCEKQVKATAGEREQKILQRQVHELVKHLYHDLYDLSADRIELFTNKQILGKIVERSEGNLDAAMVGEVVNHMRDQITVPDQPILGEIDPEYAKTLDDRDAMDEWESIEEVYNSIDVEDFTIMFELLRFYAGGLKGLTNAVHTYVHMVLDEAQELSTLELRLLGHLLEAGGSVSIAGDALQQLDATSVFAGWEQSLKHLGLVNVKSEYLKTSYRCPAPIMNFAYDVLGDLAQNERPRAAKEGVPVMITRASDEGHAAVLMLESLEQLLTKEPKASIAVIAADFDTAKIIYQGIKDLPRVRLIREGDFDFIAGIDVTDVTQVKGLEFDYVVVPDCDIYHYPETAEARRALHVASTRAIHQLWVIAVKSPSHLIPKPMLTDLHNYYTGGS